MFIAILTTVKIGVTLLFPSLGISPSEVVEVIQPKIVITAEPLAESSVSSPSKVSGTGVVENSVVLTSTYTLEVSGTGPIPLAPYSGPVGTSEFGYTAGYSPLSPNAVIDTPTRSEIAAHELLLASNSSLPSSSPASSSVFPSPVEYPGRHPNSDASDISSEGVLNTSVLYTSTHESRK